MEHVLNESTIYTAFQANQITKQEAYQMLRIYLGKKAFRDEITFTSLEKQMDPKGRNQTLRI